jgi:hypothetical protein
MDALAAIRDNIVSLYAKKTGRDKEEVGALMDATSWWTGTEAKENGFVDELVDDEEETVTENRGGFLFVNGIGTRLLFDEAPEFVQDSRAAHTAAGRFVNKKPGREPEKNNKEERNMEIKTVDDLQKAYPELTKMIEAAASEKAAADERQRIRDIEEMSIAGSEDFVKEAKYEKPIGAGEFAMQAVKRAKQAEDEKKANYLAGIKKDAADSGMEDVKPEAALTDGQEDEVMDALKAMKKE